MFTVDKEGNIKAVGNGTEILTATLGDFSKKITIVVSDIKVSGINLNKTETTIKINGEDTLIGTVFPDNASNKTVIWKSDNDSIATVKDGVVKGISKGIANITATTQDGNYSASCKVNVICNHIEKEHEAEESTCKEQGHLKYVECEICGELLSGNKDFLPLAEHRLSNLIPRVEHSMTDEGDLVDGVEEHYKCLVCGKLIAKDKKTTVNEDDLRIKASHTYGDYEADANKHWKECGCGNKILEEEHKGGEASCAQGTICEVCGVEYGEVNSTNHVNKETRNAKQATCTEKGYTGDTYCKDCGIKLSDGKEIPATGHKGGKATSTKGAICEICGVEYTKKLDEETHTAQDNITFQDNYLKAEKTITIRQNANGKSVSYISLLADIINSAFQNKFPEVKITSKLIDNIGTGKVVKLSNGENITVIYKGDVNGDGRVSITDAAIMVRASNGKLKLTPAQEKAGDIGGVANKVNASDAAVVVRLLNGGKNAEKAYNKIAEYMPEDM